MKTKRMTAIEASRALEHAEEVIAGCDDLEALEEAAKIVNADADCPEGFTEAQREFSQRVILAAYMKAIGRC